MIKFLHIADVHLDTSFYSRSEDIRSILREGIRNSFERAIDICIDEGVDALLIAGDLFDNDKLSFKTEQFLISQFNRLKENGIMVVYASGNHDPGDIGYRANSIKWPENVRIFRGDTILQELIYDKKGDSIGRIIGCGHKTKNEGRNLIESFPVKDEEIPYIGLAHAMVTNASGAKNHEKYLPCTVEDLEVTRYDYWALGHIHKRQKISENSYVYYPGNIQGRSPRETGTKGGLLVTIDDQSNVSVEFKPLSTIIWNTIIIKDLENIKDYRDLRKHLAEVIGEFIKTNKLHSSNIILRVELEGRAFLKKDIEIEENRDEIIQELILDLDLLDLEIKTDRLLNTVNIEDYRDGDHILAYVLKVLDNIDVDGELMNKLEKLSFSNESIMDRADIKSYIEELIVDLDEEAVNWMVGEGNENK